MKIQIHYDPKPIPDRRFDWVAYEDGYDPGEPDGEGGYSGGDPIGHGATEAEAIADLMAKSGTNVPTGFLIPGAISR